MTQLQRILHIDDDPDIREIARLSLENLGGFELVQCANAKECMQAAKVFAPDLFLLDARMPVLSGIEVLRELRTNNRFAETPAIFLTAKNQMTAQEFAPMDRVLGIIHKPFDPVDLPKTIRSLYDGHFSL